ncbi:unnamed protein product [Paramecium pentaurelia]|uniref:Uncharacterized protein n=1 Tax=Paramecium pentaurelia TaxID=43138 RepID=A0A8S1TMH0_9CILI|nr:unnamed protein product [Paramecium pentaurelia]
MTDRSRTTSFQKQQILQNIQIKFQKIDPTFQIKNFIGESTNLVGQQIKKWEKQSRERTVKEQQVMKAIKSLRHPLILESYMEKPIFIESIKPETPYDLEVPQQISQSPKNEHINEYRMIKSTKKPLSPLKKLFEQYSELVQEQFQNSSEEMKKLIQQYSNSEKAIDPFKQKTKYCEYFTPRQISIPKKNLQNSQSYKQIGSPMNRKREYLVQKNNNNLQKLDDLQSDLDNFRKHLKEIKKSNQQCFHKRQFLKGKLDFLL